MHFWDTALPRPLAELHELEFDYADGDGIDFEPYSAFLPAEETGRWFRSWTGNNEASGSQFRVFGQDGSGGHAAFWLASPVATILDQPIVFLGSEGEAGVIAADFHDYLWLLANNIAPSEAVAHHGFVRVPNRPFLAFAEKHSARDPMGAAEVLSRAQKAYPNFAEQVCSLCR